MPSMPKLPRLLKLPKLRFKKNAFKHFFANQKVAMMIMKLDKFFIKLPHLPKKFQKFISKIVPWLVLLGGIIGAVTVALSLTLVVLSIIALDLGLIMSMVGSMLFVLLNTLFLVKAFKPLRKYDAVGWIYLFWANILGVINSIISVVNRDIVGWQSITTTVVLTLVGFYLLFEIGGFYEFRREEVELKKKMPKKPTVSTLPVSASSSATTAV